MSSSARNPKIQKRYEQHLKNAPNSECEFCAFTSNNRQVIQELPHYWLVNNIFPYDIWDTSGVLDHKMLVPKRHITALGELTDEEKLGYFAAITEHEQDGYSIYARAPANKLKSVIHQHTHLIKIDGNKKNLILYTHKPYLLITK